MALSARERGRLGALASKSVQQEAYQVRLAEYSENPKHCEECCSAIPYAKRHAARFCNSTCSARFNNKRRSLKINRPCLSCSKQLRGHSGQQYCSIVCQKSYERQKAVENGLASAKTMKRWLIEQHGERCMDSECAWDFTKRPLKVELDHRDGDAFNNSQENVWLLCPNCHSLTDTYKSRNKGRGRHLRRER